MTRPLKMSVLPLLWITLSSPGALAISYGIYEARGQAMGGAGVAVSSWHQAQYYNPALLALNDESENTSLDSRFVVPNLVAQVDDSAQDVIDAADDELQENLQQAVAAYNNSRSAAAAATVAERARDLQSLLLDLGNRQIEGEVAVGLSVSEPSEFEGGAFFISSRAISFADSVIPAADYALLSDYIAAMDTLAAGGNFADLPAHLLDDEGRLSDPADSFDSSASITAFNLLEWGVSVSRRFEFWGQGLAVGVTPKILSIMAVSDTTDFGDDSLEFDRDIQPHLSMNADLGLVVELAGNYRIGLACKDVIPEHISTENGAELNLQPRTRLGAAYINSWLALGLDLDVGENSPVANEAPVQEASLGVEMSPLSWLDVRFGYRQDLSGNRQDTLSGGLSYRLKRLVVEVSYGKSDLTTSAGLQLGWRF